MKHQLYKSGVYTAKCGTNLDHGVLVVSICHLRPNLANASTQFIVHDSKSA